MLHSKNRKLIFLFPVVFFALSLFLLNFSSNFSFLTYNNQNITSVVAEEELDSEYFLYNTSLYNFPSNPTGLNANVENQKSSDLCWAFSSIAALETTLYTTGLVDKSISLNFSELDLAYNVFVESRDWETLGGGAFEVAFEYFSSDNGPVNEQTWEKANNLVWTVDIANIVDFYENGIATNGRTKSGYSALESYYFPSREVIKFEDERNGVDESVTAGKILANRNNIKNHILTYGAVTATMFYNINYLSNDYYYYNQNQPANHMVTLVGWDDDIIIDSHTGAYIAQNSYGQAFGNGGFFYISYDDKLIENNVCGFTRVDENLTDYIEYDNMSGSEYENQFVTFDIPHITYYSSFYSYESTVYSANIYQINPNYEDQYIARIKVPTTCVVMPIKSGDVITGYSQNYDSTIFKVYILNNLSSNLQTVLNSNFNNKIPVRNLNATSGDEYLFSSNQTGYYTIEMGEQVNLTGNYFAIIFEIQDGNLFYMRNNPTQSISYPTYISQYPTSSWTVYGYTNPTGTNECVLPMIIQTKYDLNAMSYEVTGGTYTYDGQPKNPTVNVTNPTEYVVSYSQDGINFSSNLPNIKNVKRVEGIVSAYDIYVKIEADYYDTVIVQVQIRINPKTLVITPTPVTNVYGSAYIRPMCEYSGVIYGESVNSTGILSVENFNLEGLNNVGQYNIIQNSLKLVSKNNFNTDNYEISFVSNVKYTITPKTIELLPNEQSKHYGESDPVLTYHFVGVEGSQNPNVSANLTREDGENVGQYAISYFGDFVVSDDIQSEFYASNYNVVFGSDIQYFSIVPRILTITPNAGQFKIFGDDDQIFTFTASNTISGETPAYVGSLSRILGEDAGNYQITLGNLQIVDNELFLATNYTLEFSLTTVYFKIFSGLINDSFVFDISDFYNGELHFIIPTSTSEYTVRYSEVSSKTDAFNEETASNENIGKKECGVYYICFEFKKENYVSKFETAKITISPINLSVTPLQNQSRTYGETDEILFEYFGNISGETPSFIGSLSREVGEDVGQYVILGGDLTLQNGTNFSSSNYILIFENPDEITYEITKRTLTVTPNDSQRKFYGRPDPVLTFSSSGYVFSENADFTGALSRESGENVGEYAISIGSLSLGETLNQNYVMAFDETTHYFEITPVSVLIRIINLTDQHGNYLLNYYGEISFNTVSYVFEQGTEVNFVEGDDLELEYLCYEIDDTLISNTTPEGNYFITAISNNENYNVSIFGNSSYTITYKNYVVTFVIEESDITRTKTIKHFSSVGELPDGINEIPTKAGYIFKNWEKTTNNLTWVKIENIKSEIIEGVTKFRAKMELITYRVYYNLNGGSLSSGAPYSFNIDTQTFSLIPPTREGYTFIGFYENSDFSGQQVTQILQGTTRNYTLYAKWEINSYSITLPSSNVGYTLTVLSGSSTSINYGSNFVFEINLLSSHNKSYETMKVFVLWQGGEEQELTPQRISDSDNDGIKNRYTISSVVDSFEILISDVTINFYTIEFKADLTVVETIYLSHGESLLSINYPQIPQKQYYDEALPTWSLTTDIINASQDLEIRAIYTPNTYIVTFIMQDGMEIQISTTYGTPVDTSALSDEYQLNIFEYFVFAKPLYGISSDETIRVTIGSNINLFFGIAGSIVGLIILIIIVVVVRKRHRHQASWIPFSKMNREEYEMNLEKLRRERDEHKNNLGNNNKLDDNK